MIEARHLPASIAPAAGAGGPAAGGEGVSLDEMERVFIEAALRRNGWNRSRTAEELKIDRSTLRRKMKAFGIEQPRGEAAEE
jgi:DNA-binding NtrC family response regulator